MKISEESSQKEFELFKDIVKLEAENKELKHLVGSLKNIIEAKKEDICTLKTKLDCACLHNKELKQQIEMYKECFEKYIPDSQKDEATMFLSTYGSGLALAMSKRGGRDEK